MHATRPVPARLRAALARDEWFASAPDALQETLLALASEITLAEGQSLFSRGAEAEGLCCVLAGALRIGAITADGTATTLAYLEPYQWFGEVSVIDELPRTHDAVADCETRVLVAPRQPLLQWLDDHPVHWRALARLACRKLRVALGVLEETAVLPLEQRLQRRLWLLSGGYGSHDATRRHLRVGQELLAQMMGVSRQSVNKALKALEARGLVRLRYGSIELLDAAAAPPQQSASP